MPDFRIIEIVLDNQMVFIRRETVGASTIGGDDEQPYQPHVVQGHFMNMLAQNGTDMDRAVASASSIQVNILCELNGTVDQADAVKAHEIKRAKEGGLYQVLNAR